MKKIILILVFGFLNVINAQPDPSDKITYEFLKSQEITTSLQKPIVIEELNKILSRSNDSTFTKKVVEFKKQVEGLTFDNEKIVDFSKISDKQLRKYTVKEDEFTGTVWIYSNKYGPNLYPYIGIKDNVMFLRLLVTHSARDWIFMDTAVLLVSNEKFEIALPEPDRKVTSGAYVRERSDLLLNEETIEILRLIAEQESDVKMRLKGRYSSDYKLKKRDRQKIAHLLELYDIISGTK